MPVSQTGASSTFKVAGDYNDVQGNYNDHRITQHITIKQMGDSETVSKATYVYEPLHPISPRFTGQGRYLEQIRSCFSSQEVDAPMKRCCLLHGTGGVGKTQIALKYAEDNSERFWRIFWLDASSPEAMNLSFKTIAADPDAVAAGVEASPTSVFRWLSRAEQDWLLIYDNADGDPNDIEGYLPSSSRGNLLLTSRNPNMVRFVSSPEGNVEVDNMETDDAAALLLKWVTPTTPKESEAEAERLARSIARELCCLPLAVDQAGAAIKSGLCNIGDYLIIYSHHRARLMSDPSFKGASNYGRAVYATWDLSVTAISTAIAGGSNLMTSRAAEMAIFLLEMLGFFHHEKISEEIFKRAAEAPVEHSAELVKEPSESLSIYLSRVYRMKQREQLDEQFLHDFIPPCLLQLDDSGIWDPLFFRDGMRILISFSLVKNNASGNLYSFHPLVHSWSRDRMINDERRTSRSYSASALLARSISWNFRAVDYAFRRDLVPHIKSYQLHTFKAAGSEDTTDKFALAYNENGQYEDAEELRVRVLQSRKKVLGARHPYTLNSMLYLAGTYFNQGRWKDAEKLQVTVLELSRSVRGAEHPDTLTSMSHLATTYRSQGRWNEAEGLEVQVLDLDKTLLGVEHPHTLISMLHLAEAYFYQGRWEKAEEQQMEVLKLSGEVRGGEHPDTLTSMSHLARTYRSQGRWKEAEKLEVQVLQLSKRVLGPEHPHTSNSMTHLAATYFNQGHWKEAEELQIAALELIKKVRGAEHPYALACTGNLAATYRSQGRWKKAEELEVALLDLSKRTRGAEHPHTLACMANLAATYRSQGHWKKAEGLEVVVLELIERVRGSEHPDTLACMANLAETYQCQERWKEAEELEFTVLELSKRVLGVDHPHTLARMANLAETYRSQKHWKEAEELEVAALELSKRVCGAEHPHTLVRMGSLAVTLRSQGRLDDAEELGIRVFELRERVLGAEHPDTMIGMVGLALTRKKLKKDHDAIVLMRKAVNLMVKVAGSDHPQTIKYSQELDEWTKESGDASDTET